MKGKGWTMADVESLMKRGVKVKMAIKAQSIISAKPEPKALQFIKETLTRFGIEYVEEYRFDTVRRFRFDIAMPDKMLAIEYEGLFSEKSGHTTIGGYNKDCTKYNIAQLSGWVVLRYTASNYNDFTKDIETFLHGKENLSNL